MLVRIDATELSAMAKELLALSGDFERIRSAAGLLFAAGHPTEASSLLSVITQGSAWAVAWADNLSWRVKQVSTAELVATGSIPSLAIPGHPDEVAEFLLREDVSSEDWESGFSVWRQAALVEAFVRRVHVGWASRRLANQFLAARDLDELLAFVDTFEQHAGERDLLAAFFNRLGPEQTARIVYFVQNETRQMDREQAAGIMTVFAQALATVVTEGRVGEGFVREFIDYDGWTLGQFLIHTSFDEQFIVDAVRAMLSMDGRFNERGSLYHYGWEAIGDSEESFRPQRMALLALAANPGAAVRVMDELYSTDWATEGLDAAWPAEFALALKSGLDPDNALRANRLALAAIVRTSETGLVSQQTALVLAEVYERHIEAFAAAAELEVRDLAPHAWAGGIALPKETAWRFLSILFDSDEAVAPLQDATARYLAGRASSGVTGETLDWAGDVGALTQLVYDAHAASVIGEAQRNDATEAFFHGLLNKAVGVVTLPGGPATKFVKGVGVDRLFEAIDDDFAGAARDEIAGMRQTQLELETLLVANAYHKAGLTDRRLIEEAVTNAQRRYPGMEADFVDAVGHLIAIDELNQAQLAALAEWLNTQEDLWRDAATEIARAARAVTVVTQDANVRTP